jgi:imidazole glycerol-phosphate synthase subunit HisH
MPTIAVIDCGVGNLRSVQKMLERFGAVAPIVNSPSAMQNCNGIVLPGVGAFRDAMRQLNDSGLSDAICKQVLVNRIPILGICLGMQLLTRDSIEGEPTQGLGLIDAEVRPLIVKNHKNWAGRKLTLPHIGWNSVTSNPSSKLFADIPSGSDFYFVHSYHVICKKLDMIAAHCNYGEKFICGLEHENIFAGQFHPEKSQAVGQQLLRNFVDVVSATETDPS